MAQNPYDLFSPEVDELMQTKMASQPATAKSASAKSAPPVEAATEEPGILAKFMKFFETPLTSQNETTAKAINTAVGLDDVGPNGELSNWGRAKAFGAGAIEGITTPSTIVNAIALKGAPGVLKAGWQASKGINAYLKFQKTKAALEAAPALATAVKEMSGLASKPAVIGANAALGLQGANTALDSDQSTFNRVLGGAQAIGGFGTAGAGYLAKGVTPEAKAATTFYGKTPKGEDLLVPPPTGRKVELSELAEASKGRKNFNTPATIKESLEQELGQLDDPTTRVSKARELGFEDTLAEQNRLKEALQHDLPSDKSLKEVVKGKVDEAKAQNKFVMDEANQEAKNLNKRAEFEDAQDQARGEFLDKTKKAHVTDSTQQARNLNAQEDFGSDWSASIEEEIAENASKTRESNMREGLESKGKSISETSKVVGPDGKVVTTVERFGEKSPEAPSSEPTKFDKPAKPGPPKGPLLGRDVVPEKAAPKRNFFKDKREALMMAMNRGGASNVRFHEPTQLWEVFDDPALKIQPHVTVNPGDPIVPVIIPEEGAPKVPTSKKADLSPNEQKSVEELTKIVDKRGGSIPVESAKNSGPALSPEELANGKAIVEKQKGIKGLKVAKTQAEDYTPEEWDEYDRIMAEMDNQPFEARKWNEDGSPDVEVKSGNLSGRGNRAKVVERPFKPGKAGAKVFDDLVQVEGTNVGRGTVVKGLKDFKAGKKSVWGQRAMEVARKRLADRKAFPREDVDGPVVAAAADDPKVVSGAVDPAEVTIDGAIAAAQKGGYTGDPAVLKANLIAAFERDGLSHENAQFLGSENNWWDDINNSVQEVTPTPDPSSSPQGSIPVKRIQQVMSQTPGSRYRLVQNMSKAAPPERGGKGTPLHALARKLGKEAFEAGKAEKAANPSSGWQAQDVSSGKVSDIPAEPSAVTPEAIQDVEDLQNMTPELRKKAIQAMIDRENYPGAGDETYPKGQPNLLEGVRDVENPTPEFEAPLALTPEAAETSAVQDSLFDLEPPAKPKKAKPSNPNQSSLFDNPEAGAQSMGLAGRMGLAVAGGAGGREVGKSDENDSISPNMGMAIGAAAGFVGPDVARKLIDVARTSGADEDIRQAAQAARDTVSHYAQILPDYYRFALLANFPNLPINAIVGPYGSAVMKALEHTIALDPRGPKALAKLARMDKFMKEWYLADDAGTLIEQAHSRGEAGSEAFEKLNPIAKKILSWPGEAMTRGDIAARNMLMDSNFDLGEARAATLTDEPELASLKGIRAGMQGAETEGGKRGIAYKMMLPFHKTLLNQLEGGLERLPGSGLITQLAKDIPDSPRLIAAQQILGGGTIYAAFKLGESTPYDNLETPILTKVISNAGGQYGTIAAAAFLAGQAYGAGSEDAPLRFVTEIINSTALPATRSLTDMAKTGWKGLQMLSGQEPVPTLDELRQNAVSGTIPQVLKYEDVKEKSSTIENMIRRQFQTPPDPTNLLDDTQ